MGSECFNITVVLESNMVLVYVSFRPPAAEAEKKEPEVKAAPAPAPAAPAPEPAAPAPAAKSEGVGVVSGGASGGRVLPKEEIDPAVLNMLKVSSLFRLLLDFVVTVMRISHLRHVSCFKLVQKYN